MEAPQMPPYLVLNSCAYCRPLPPSPNLFHSPFPLLSLTPLARYGVVVNPAKTRLSFAPRALPLPPGVPPDDAPRMRVWREGSGEGFIRCVWRGGQGGVSVCARHARENGGRGGGKFLLRGDWGQLTPQPCGVV